MNTFCQLLSKTRFVQKLAEAKTNEIILLNGGTRAVFNGRMQDRSGRSVSIVESIMKSQNQIDCIVPILAEVNISFGSRKKHRSSGFRYSVK